MTEYFLPAPEQLEQWGSGKVAIVTGGAQGIGFAITKLLADAGTKVVIADVDADVGNEAANRTGKSSTFIKCDVTSWDDQLQLFEHTVAKYGRIDLVVLNAAINPELSSTPESGHDVQVSAKPKYLHSSSRSILDVNFIGTAYGIDLALQHMNKTGGGRIIVTGSIGSYMGVANQAVYSASKHAVLGLVRAISAREDVMQSDIAISVVAPSLTRTRMTEHIMSFLPPEVLVSSPEDVAGAVGIIVTQPLEKMKGKSILVQGSTYVEAEETLTQCFTSMLR